MTPPPRKNKCKKTINLDQAKCLLGNNKRVTYFGFSLSHQLSVQYCVRRLTNNSKSHIIQDYSRGFTITVCCGWHTPPTTHSNQFQLFHDSSRQQYGVTVTRCCSYIPISRPKDATCDRFLLFIYMCITLHISSVKRSSLGVPHREGLLMMSA
jgi:hypothetical protein